MPIRRIVSILILCAFSFQLSAKSVILLHYWLNKAYISKTLCEKKEIANNTCQGKCHLKKELKKQGSKEDSPLQLSHLKDIQEALASKRQPHQLFLHSSSAFSLLLMPYSFITTNAFIGLIHPPPEKS